MKFVPSPFRKVARNAKIIRQREAGLTYAEIAKLHDISWPRVRYIVKHKQLATQGAKT